MYDHKSVGMVDLVDIYVVEGTNQNFSVLGKAGLIWVCVVGMLGNKPGIGDDDASVRITED